MVLDAGWLRAGVLSITEGCCVLTEKCGCCVETGVCGKERENACCDTDSSLCSEDDKPNSGTRTPTLDSGKAVFVDEGDVGAAPELSPLLTEDKAGVGLVFRDAAKNVDI